MTLKDLVRRKIILILLLLIPSVFYAVTYLTTDMMIIPFKLAAVIKEPIIMIPARNISLIFLGLSSAGLLAAFLSMNLIQRNIEVNRRLVICGYTTGELVVSKLIILLIIITLLAFYVGSMLWIFFDPKSFFGVILGFMLIGFVYGSYGFLIGALLKGELEGILVVTLLANIDVGWLQNPIFYAGATNKEIIRSLPAFYPSQTSIISAFSLHSVSNSVMLSMAYGTALLVIALIIYWLKMRTR
jgi:hypothetical protein